MKTWSDRPFGTEVAAEIVAGEQCVISPSGGGESEKVYEIAGYSGWLVKRYRGNVRAHEVAALDQLIELPGTMSLEERALVDASMAWPVSRVVAGKDTIGVVMAKASDAFLADFALPGGRSRREPLTLDHLAVPDEKHHIWGFPPISLHDRLAIVRSVVSTANLIENNGLVYGDWSYSNAFWSQGLLCSFVIDMDSCRFGRRSWVEGRSGDFSDPLLADGQPVTTLNDRYRVSLLSIRCITGIRDVTDLGAVVFPPPLRDSELAGVLRACLAAASVTSRPSLPELLTALDDALGRMSGEPAEDSAQNARIALERSANVRGYRDVVTGEYIPAGRSGESVRAARRPAARIAVIVLVASLLIIVIAVLIGYVS
jgi:hypothetical protein